jgi:hypothetical protein
MALTRESKTRIQSVEMKVPNDVSVPTYLDRNTNIGTEEARSAASHEHDASTLALSDKQISDV